MPAAAVIPAPIAYTKIVAVKKLVVGFLVLRGLFRHSRLGCLPSGEWLSGSDALNCTFLPSFVENSSALH